MAGVITRRASPHRVVVGLRREDPARIWERRSPLTPLAVNNLVEARNAIVHVQHCDRRVFRDHEYQQAGAKIVDHLQDADIIVGIKETPLPELLISPVHGALGRQCARTHLMFSHTAKGQTYNMALLSKFVAEEDPLTPRLIDYEHLTDNTDGKRTVGFGWFAGVAGVLESLSSMAHSHLELGVASPFLYTPRPHTLPSLARLRAALREIGHRIATDGTPPSLGPFIIGLTGSGNVANGCLSILEELPIQHVSVEDLDALVRQEDPDLRKIYLVHAHPRDYLTRLDGYEYNRDHYYANGDLYRSTFGRHIAPYLTLFLNGVGWAPNFPRLMTSEDLRETLYRAGEIGGARFRNIGDISCDPGGGLEFLPRSSTLSDPFYKTRPSTLPDELPPVQMMAVDILPASIPLDASEHFSTALLPYLESLIDSYQKGQTRTLSPELERATIAAGGRLTEKHRWLQDSVNKFRANSKPSNHGHEDRGVLHKKKVLMLGSGMVAGPAVEHIARREHVQLLIASNSSREAPDLSRHYTNVKYKVIDMKEEESLAPLIADADVVISLLPAGFHPVVAEQCIKHRKHLVTASYPSDAMKALNERAIAADVLLLNEIGLDPGFDHCSAISLISNLKAEGKSIVAFTSFCGGLPAPDVPAVPLRYKFSWNPRGVLTAALNSARYKLANKMHHVPGSDLLRSYYPSVPVTKEFALEGLPNRDSFQYLDMYGLGSENLRTVLRGTLRYPGFSSLMETFRVLGFLEMQKTIRLESWSSFLRQSVQLQLPSTGGPGSFIEQAVNSEDTKHALEWLSLVPASGVSQTTLPPLPSGPMSPLDIFAYLLSFKLRFLPDERDMVVLSHEIIAHKPGMPEEVHSSSLVTFGTNKATAMARTVGIPVAIAALEVLDGKVAVRGVVGPTDPSVYRPVLSGMEEAGLGMKEVITTGQSIEQSLLL